MGFSRCAIALLLTTSAHAAAAEKIEFVKTPLDTTFRSEGVAVGDFNKDGKSDIAAGSVYYAAPDWKMHPVREKADEFDPHNYSNSFCNFADDLNGDGWVDLIVVDFPGAPTWWYENPQTSGVPWQQHVCIDVTNNESPTYLDVDGDGKRELVCSTDEAYIVARRGDDPYAKWNVTELAKGTPKELLHKYYHGLGVGDVNKDGRNDVVIPHGWFESPADKAAKWPFHAVSLGPACAQMHVYDFDGDGDNDVLSSSAHAYGIWLHEQTPEGFKTQEIDKSFSQTHSLCLADINGDGLLDFVTGKRWWAHGPKGDVGADQPAVMCWFELSRREGRAVWTKHQLDHNSGVGTQFEVADVDKDGLLDVVTSNKQGVFFFRQTRGK
jgi:hypothetical protein